MSCEAWCLIGKDGRMFAVKLVPEPLRELQKRAGGRLMRLEPAWSENHDKEAGGDDAHEG